MSDLVVRPTPAPAVLLARGLTVACPVCGRRGITHRWWTMLEHCPRCGFRFERAPGHFVGAVGVSTIVTAVAVLAVVLIGTILTLPDLAVVPIIAAGLVAAVGIPVFGHPVARTTWIALDLIMKPLEPGEAPGRPEEGPPQQR